MSDQRPFDLIIFDCDGVLIDSERLINRVESQHLARLGLTLSPDECRARFKGHTLGEGLAMIAALRGGAVSPEWLYDWGMHIALGFVRDLRAVSGVAAVVDRVGAPTCVASQAPRARVDLALSVTDLARRFDDRVYTASLVPRGKPYPDLFLYAAARMGAEPGRCAVIEDSDSGVRAAVAAGMTAFGYAADEDAEALARAGATVFRSMDGLPSLLEHAPARPAPPSAAVADVRRAYAAFAAGDRAPLATLLAPDIVYHPPGSAPAIRGRAAVLDRTARAAASCDVPPTIRLDAVTGAGDVVLSIERFAATRRGRRLDQDVCAIWQVVDERCVEIRSCSADEDAWARFWAD